MLVTLTDQDLRRAGNEARGRRNGTTNRSAVEPAMLHTRTGEDRLQIDVDSCCGELAVAKALDLPWTGETGDKYIPNNPDVGTNIEVKTKFGDHDGLYLPLTKLYTLKPSTCIVVTRIETINTVRLLGWIKADYVEPASYPHRRNNRIFANIVPIDRLWPIEKLVKHYAAIR